MPFGITVYNSAVAAGSSVTIGFQGALNGSYTNPTAHFGGC